MGRKKIIALLITTLLLTLCFTGCATFDNFREAYIDKPQDKSTIVQIGVFEPLSGADKDAAADEIEGIELAHEMYPTVNGKSVELIYADNSSDIDAAETAVNTLLSREPAFILGSYGNVYSLAAGRYINEAMVPAIAITNSNPLITRNNPYYCRVCYVDSNQGDLLARYVLNDRKEKAAGVLAPKGDEAAQAEATEFADRMRAETANDDAVTLYEYFEPGSKDFTKELSKVRRSGVKQVMIAGEISDAAAIINQAAGMGLNVQFLGSTDWGDEEFRNMLNDSVTSSDLAFVQFFAADGEAATANVNQQKDIFLKAYKKKHGNSRAEPADAVALGYDAYCLALDAISKAPENATGKDIRDMLMGPQYQYEGASGLINFSSIGDPIKTAYISTWADGKVNTLYTIEPIE